MRRPALTRRVDPTFATWAIYLALAVASAVALTNLMAPGLGRALASGAALAASWAASSALVRLRAAADHPRKKALEEGRKTKPAVVKRPPNPRKGVRS